MKRWKWPVVWAVQWLVMLVVGALIAFSVLLGGWLSDVVAWVGMSAAGLISAYRATRRGLLNYAAWIAPPVCMGFAHWLIWWYPPHAGPVLLSALVSLVGAAAGEVKNQQENAKQK